MKNILVTGCAGFIGSVTCEILIEQGYVVTGIDNFSSSYERNVNKKMYFFKGKIGDKGLLEHIFSQANIECVMNFAGESIIGKSMTDPYLFFDTNVSQTLVLLEAMRKFKVKNLIHSSTASTYGNKYTSKICEDYFQEPINSYGESKLILEKMIKWYQKAYGMNYVMFRYFNVGGATANHGEDRKEETRLLPTLIDKALRDEVLDIYGNDYETRDGTAVRDYLHVVDVANAHILAMNKVNNEVYNLGSNDGFTINEIVECFEKEILGRKIKVNYCDRRPGDPPVLIASNKKAINQLGWDPINSSLEQIIVDTWNWKTKNI